MDNKKIIWDILVKYDDNLPTLGNSLSNFIKNKLSDNDILNIFKNLSNIDKNDLV
jgi:hypothetical protein